MQVILKTDVNGTGKAGAVVKVSDGFARHKLIPQGLAIEATKANMNVWKKEQAELAKRIAENRAVAEKQAALLAGKQIVIRTKAGENGKLFGSITSKDIQEAVQDQLGIEVDKKKIALDAPIKAMGDFEVEVKLFQDIKGVLKVQVTE